MEVRCRPAVMCSVLAVLCSAARASLGSPYNDRQYLNEWAVEIPGGLDAAEAIAKELDYHLVRQVGGNTGLSWSSCTIFRLYQMQQLKPCDRMKLPQSWAVM